MDRITIQKKAGEWIRKYRYAFLVVLLGIGLMLIPGKSGKKEEPATTVQPVVESISLSEELEQILSQMEGAGRVKVLLALEAGEEIIYQTDDSTSGTDSNRQDTVIVTDEDRAQSGLISQIISPVYRGAVVLCQGAERAEVRLAIVEAVSKITGLDSSQISVLKMK